MCLSWEGEGKGGRGLPHCRHGDVGAAEVRERVTTKEEAICTRIVMEQQCRNMCALIREHNRTVCAMVGLPPKEEKEDNNGSDSSGDEHIRLDPYYVYFDQ
ncbi:Pyrophosphate-energized vacuolar membrane proton pump [Hordeum vulgare]|nr:Pyrophosphate-energized vacuolar membrane proton pump [Hordeum vulgare]